MKLHLTALPIIAVLLVSSVQARGLPSTDASLFLSNVFFSNSTNGWMLGCDERSCCILHTTDGGQNWSEQYRSARGLLNIKFVGQEAGWAVGSDGTIIHTSTGGATWETQTSGTTALLTGLATVDTQTAWVSGANGVLLFTTDSGHTWRQKKLNTTVGISDVLFPDKQTGWAVGYGTILSTNDSGNTWSLRSSGDRKQLSSITVCNKAVRITCGPVILRSTDGGTTYTETIPPAQGQIAGLSFVDATHGWVATARGREGSVAHIPGYDRLSSESFILSTNDGGASWHVLYHLQSKKDHSAWVTDLFFVDERRGWAVGRDGLVLLTRDGGRNWKKIKLK